jgi:hypothetical protein
MLPAVVHTTPAVSELDDELAVAAQRATTGQALVAAGRGLRFALRAVDSWRAAPGRAECLCRAAEQLRVALTLVDALTAPRLRRQAAWTGPVRQPAMYSIAVTTRILGRALEVMDRLAQGVSAPERSGPAGVVLDATARRQCRTALENAFHAHMRVLTVREANTWLPHLAADPWLLLAGEDSGLPVCTPACAPPVEGGAVVLPFRRPERRTAEPDHVC